MNTYTVWVTQHHELPWRRYKRRLEREQAERLADELKQHGYGIVVTPEVDIEGRG